METWKYFRMVITLTILSTATAGFHGFSLFRPLHSFISLVNPYLRNPFLYRFGSFIPINPRLTNLHNPYRISLSGISVLPSFTNMLYGNFRGGTHVTGTPTGGVVVGLNGLQIGYVVVQGGGRHIAVNNNHLYLGYVITQPNGNLVVIGQVGSIIGHVIQNGRNQGSTPPRPSSSFIMMGPTGGTSGGGNLNSLPAGPNLFPNRGDAAGSRI